MLRNKVLAWATIATMVTVLAIAAVVFVPQTSFAQTDNDTPTQQEPARAVRPFRLDRIGEALAEALGITVEELASARTEAAFAALDQAVANDLLTQTQADTLKERLQVNGGGMRMGGFGRLGWMMEDVDLNAGALLAEALNITVEELDAARSEAHAAVSANAVAAGEMTQEEADIFIAQAQLQPYLADARQSVIDAAIEAALANGAIDATQAEILAQRDFMPFSRMRGFGPGGGEGPRMRGFGGQDFPGMHFRGRGQGMQWFGDTHAELADPTNP